MTYYKIFGYVSKQNGPLRRKDAANQLRSAQRHLSRLPQRQNDSRDEPVGLPIHEIERALMSSNDCLDDRQAEAISLATI